MIRYWRRWRKWASTRSCVTPEMTPLGAVESWEDAKKCGALFKQHQDEIVGILVSLPNFGNEKGVADAIRLSGLDVPVLVHAFPDTTQQLTAAGRRDAFCGKLSVTNNLYQYGIPFSLTQHHVIDPASDEFVKEMDAFSRLCAVVKGMRSVRLGAIGARPQAFNTVRYSEKLLEANGISVTTLDLSEVFGWAEKLADGDPRVADKLAEIRGYAKADAAPPPSLVKMAKLGIVIGDWMDEFEIDATAIQCWETLQHNYGINACTIMSMMSDRFMPSACEVDIAGTLSMVALQLASRAPSGLVDWNNNYDDELDKCLYFHCGNWAKSLVSEIEIVPAEVLGTTLGEENTWGAVNARALAGPMTYARIDTDDRTRRDQDLHRPGPVHQRSALADLRHQGRGRGQRAAGVAALHLQERFRPPLRHDPRPCERHSGRGVQHVFGVGDVSPRVRIEERRSKILKFDETSGSSIFVL